MNRPKKEKFDKNVVMATEFDMWLLENPEIAEEMPQDCTVVFIPEDDAELAKYNLRVANLNRDKDKPVIFVKMKVPTTDLQTAKSL